MLITGVEKLQLIAPILKRPSQKLIKDQCLNHSPFPETLLLPGLELYFVGTLDTPNRHTAALPNPQTLKRSIAVTPHCQNSYYRQVIS